jgi:hypothetical protein
LASLQNFFAGEFLFLFREDHHDETFEADGEDDSFKPFKVSAFGTYWA